MLSELAIAEFHRNGFVQGGVVMQPDQAAALNRRMHSVLDGKSTGRAAASRNLLGGSELVVHQIVNIWEADDQFRAHLYNPTICSMVSALMNTGTVRVWHDQVQYKPPIVGGATSWHQDHPYWPIVEPADLVSAWVALEDADQENGCMWMVPGSHKWGPHKHGTIGTDPQTFAPLPDLNQLPKGIDVTPVPCPVRAGQVMFHHCLTWHGSPPNPSNRGRPAIAVHYMPGYTRYQPRAGHLMEDRVTVAAGEILQGEHFPTVWDGGPIEP